MLLKRLLRRLYGVGICTGLILLLLFSREITEGIQNGIRICVSLVIPSSFLFLICSEFLSRNRSFTFSFPLIARFLRIPRDQTDIVFLSMIGGYPVGARILANRVEEGLLDPDTASRMLAYCINPSPAFLYTGIGIGIFKSAETGVVLLISMLCAIAVTGAVCRPHQKAEPFKSTAAFVQENISFLFVSAVKNSIYTTALICGSVIFFSAAVSVFQSIGSHILPQAVVQYLCGLLEVCGGCASVTAGGVPRPLIAAALFASFGGVCIFMQIAAVLHKSAIRMKRALLMRFLYTSVFVLCTALMSRFFPQEVQESFAIFENASLDGFSSPPLAVSFLILLMLLLLFFSPHSATIKIKERSAKGSP